MKYNRNGLVSEKLKFHRYCTKDIKFIIKFARCRQLTGIMRFFNNFINIPFSKCLKFLLSEKIHNIFNSHERMSQFNFLNLLFET